MLKTSFASLGFLVIAGCSSASPPVCRCPAYVVSIMIPTDRANDVSSVTATGACSAAAGDGASYYAQIVNEGTCHVAVVFKSGATEFDADVPLTRCTSGECCSSCGPLASGPVTVPEADASP
jgi:hypothetical protein